MIKDIGAEYIESIEDAHVATHVIASDGNDPMRRTSKLMISLCTTSNILKIEWLVESAKAQQILDTDEFLLLDDVVAEKKYGFSMKETIQSGVLARENIGGVLGGRCVYIYQDAVETLCRGVARNKDTILRELHLIIKAAGGSVMESLSNLSSIHHTVLLTDQSESSVSTDRMVGATIMTSSGFLRMMITQNPYTAGMCICLYIIPFICAISVTLISSTPFHLTFLFIL